MAKIKFNLPSNLEEETTEYINNVLSYLKKNDKLNVIDGGALYMLADTYNTYIKASKQLAEEGLTVTSDRGNISQHPVYGIMKYSIATAMDILRDFGLTLKSRSKLNIIDSETEESPLIQFINSNK